MKKSAERKIWVIVYIPKSCLKLVSFKNNSKLWKPLATKRWSFNIKFFSRKCSILKCCPTMNKLPKFEKKVFCYSAAQGSLKSSLGTCFKKSASAIKFSTQKLTNISWKTKVDTISQMDLPVWQTSSEDKRKQKP